MSELPHVYRLLSVFSGIPLGTFEALRRSGLWEDAGPVCDSHRALLRLLTTDGRIRWVTWGPDGPGYVLTGYGEVALETYFQRYGPAHAPRRGPNLAEIVRQKQAQDADVLEAR